MPRRRNRPSTPHDRALDATASRRVWLLETLHHVSATLAQHDDIDASLQAIVEEIYTRFGFTAVGVGVVSGETIVFHAVARSSAAFRLELPRDSGVCWRVVASGRSELVKDVKADPDYVLAVDSVEREVAVPILVEGAVWGVLNVEAAAEIRLDDDDLEVMETLAMTLGLAVERSQRRRGEQRRLAQISALQHLTGRIGGRISVGDGLPDILSEARAVFDFAVVEIGLLAGTDLNFYSGFREAGIDTRVRLVRPRGAGIVGRVIETGEPAFIADVHADPDYICWRTGIKQEICVPIRAGSEVIGALNVEQDGRCTLDETDLHITQTLADQIGLAITNQRRIERLERRNRHLQTVQRVTSLIASKLKVRDALSEIVHEIDAAFGFGSAFLSEIRGDRLYVLAMEQRLPDDSMFYLENGVPLATGVIGRVARTGVPALLPDVSLDPDYLATSPQVRSEICVPIPIGGRTAGVLNIETPAARPLDEDDLEMLTIVANHLGLAIERSDLYVAEQRSRRAIEAVQRVSTIVASTLDPDEALRLIVETLAETFSYPVVAFRLLEDGLLIASRDSGLNGQHRPLAIPVGEGIAGRVAASGEPIFIPDARRDTSGIRLHAGVTSELCVPIFSGGELAGVLSIEGTDDRPLTPQDLELMGTFAEHAGTLLNNARLYARMRHLASRDAITDLPNHREFQRKLRDEIVRVERYGHALSLLVIDLDQFKQVNDRFGHLAGDDVLRALGARMKSVLRESDLLARYAGDEFVVLLPETDRAAAEITARRLRLAVANEPFEAGDTPLHLCLSIGVASVPEDATTSEELIRIADQAMYAQKTAAGGQREPRIGQLAAHREDAG